jgi:hypothetical protein
METPTTTPKGKKPKQKRIETVYSPSKENWKKVAPNYKLNGKG